MMKRNDTMAIAKGVAIVLMVVGHATTKTPVEGFVGLFHMPLFFFTAGYFFKPKYFDCPFQFVWKRVRGLIFPYWLGSMLFILFHNVLFDAGLLLLRHGDGRYSFGEMAQRLLRLFLLMPGTEDLLGGYWFLPVLFIASIVSFCLLWLVGRRMEYGSWVCVAVAIALSILLKALRLPGSWQIANSLFGAVFWLMGSVMNGHEHLWGWNKGRALLFATFLALGFVFWRTGMTPCSARRIPFYLCSAFSGIALTLMLSSCLSTLPCVHKCLVYVGEHTLGILTWHLSAFKVVSVMCICIGISDRSHLSDFPTIQGEPLLVTVLYVLVGVLVPLEIVRVYEKVRMHLVSR